MGKWVDSISDEDIVFIKRFVLASGSLKEMAMAYGLLPDGSDSSGQVD